MTEDFSFFLTFMENERAKICFVGLSQLYLIIKKIFVMNLNEVAQTNLEEKMRAIFDIHRPNKFCLSICG